MKKFFTSQGLLGLGSRLWSTLRGASDSITKAGEAGLNKSAKAIYRSSLDDFQKLHGRIPNDSERHILLESAGKTAEDMKGSLAKRLGIAAAVGVPVATAAVGTGATISSALSGKDSVVYDALENVMETGKKADATTDVRGFFTRLGEGLRMLAVLFQNLGPLFSGKIQAKDLFSENDQMPEDADGKFDPAASGTDTGASPNSGLDRSDAATLAAGAAGIAGVSAAGYKTHKFLKGIGDSTPSVDAPGIHAADDVAEAAAKGKGFKMGGVKGNLAVMGAVGAGTFLYSTFNGSSAAEASEVAITTAVPFADAANKARQGDIEGAELSAAQDAGGLAGFAGGAAVGAAAGATVGSVVPLVGTAIGGVVGGVVGGIAGSVGGSWAGEKLFNVFNSEAEGAPKADNLNHAPAANLTTAPKPQELAFTG